MFEKAIQINPNYGDAYLSCGINIKNNKRKFTSIIDNVQ